MHERGLRRPGRAADRRRDARASRSRRRSCSPTRPAHEVDMVFQFDHVWVDRGADPWLLHPLQLTDLKAIFGRWQAGLAERRLEQPLLEQPRPAAGGLPVRRRQPAYRVASAKMLGTVLHLHRGTPYVYQGEELGMTNYPFALDRRLPGHRGARPVRPGGRPGGPLAGGRADRAAGPRPGQRPYARCSGTPRRTPASPPARRGWRSTPTTSRSTRRPRPTDPDSVYHYYRRLIELRHTEPAVVDGDFTMLLPHDERLYAFTRRLGDTSCW